MYSYKDLVTFSPNNAIAQLKVQTCNGYNISGLRGRSFQIEMDEINKDIGSNTAILNGNIPTKILDNYESTEVYVTFILDLSQWLI